tara:strand:+ start:206 stop:916 length:711 start_codon:yes stop_codon:yes gene_type:complete
MSTTGRFIQVVMMSAAFTATGSNVAHAQTQSLGLNLGYFAVKGEDTRIFDDVIATNRTIFEFDLSQFNNASVGAEWLVEVGDYVEAGVGVGFYQQTVLSYDREFVHDDGSDILQDFKLRVTPVTVVGRFFPFSLRSPIQPYAGAGVGAFNWRYSEVGDFVDRGTLEIFRDRFVATETDVGAVYLVGVRVDVGDRYRVGFEARYQDAKGVVGIDQGFLDERIDLSGLTSVFTVGVRF